MSGISFSKKRNKIPPAESRVLTGYTQSVPGVICLACRHIHDGGRLPSISDDDEIESCSSDYRRDLGLKAARNVRRRPSYHQIQEAKLIWKRNLEHSKKDRLIGASNIDDLDNVSVKSLGSLASSTVSKKSGNISKTSVKSNNTKISVSSESSLKTSLSLTIPCSCGCNVPPNIPAYMSSNTMPCMLSDGTGLTIPGMMVYDARTGMNYFCHPLDDAPSSEAKVKIKQQHPTKACCSSCEQGGICASSKAKINHQQQQPAPTKACCSSCKEGGICVSSKVKTKQQQQQHPTKACCSSCEQGGICASSKAKINEQQQCTAKACCSSCAESGPCASSKAKIKQKQLHPTKACCSSCEQGGMCASATVSHPRSEIDSCVYGPVPNRLDGRVASYTGHIPGIIHRYGESYGRSCAILRHDKESSGW